ncbi:hypothetical protein AJ79_04811 [Helicocarpus griseus UAMH5409]|uniref:Altered inheritance of mitochondria protein 9, mitochondrial n=1 Tax=Helicocarpus griseus UAMH5409 TaxID=1447875 RepID=A0A2B7XS11_9EURO|nr:hypothetical protein AJ79_04811 [Helicocarpus griseus UAMH5409]
MSKLDFPAYGSLYFSDAPSLKSNYPTYRVDEKYCIGPSCGVIYWDCDIGHPKYYYYAKPNRGPWGDLSEYTSALIDAGLKRLPPPEKLVGKWQRPFQGSVDEHLQLLHSGSKALQQLVKNIHIQNNKAPTMFHSDLHKRNIFVSEKNPMVVTGFIDWQLTRVEPAFYQAYVAGLGLLAPRLNNARNVDETLLGPFRYCHRTWRDSIVPFTYELLELQKQWDSLGFKEPCSLDFSNPEQTRVFQEREQMFNDFLEIKKDLLEMVETDDDGWILPELFEERKKLCQFLYDSLVSDIKDETDWNDMESSWPFDHD